VPLVLLMRRGRSHADAVEDGATPIH